MRNRARMQIEREIARAERSRRLCDDKRLHADSVIRRFEEAYKAAHGQAAPCIDYEHGWYVIHHSAWNVKRYREVDMLAKTNAMWGTVHAREIEADSL